MYKDRLAAFTDAILAIIMTILVLELEKPTEASWTAVWAPQASQPLFSMQLVFISVL